MYFIFKLHLNYDPKLPLTHQIDVLSYCQQGSLVAEES